MFSFDGGGRRCNIGTDLRRPYRGNTGNRGCAGGMTSRTLRCTWGNVGSVGSGVSNRC